MFVVTAMTPLDEKPGFDGPPMTSAEVAACVHIPAMEGLAAALAELIELYRADGGGRIYTRLVDRAISYLPMPTKVAKLKSDRFAALGDHARHMFGEGIFAGKGLYS
ncbi:MAG: hypothetical protein AB1714_01215 [Acidobacteriota bacterium]